MGHVLSFTHCKDAPSTASSTPDSCPPDEVHTPDSAHPAPAEQCTCDPSMTQHGPRLPRRHLTSPLIIADDADDDATVTLADLWPLPSPQEPTFSYITIGSSVPIARPPARARRGRGLGRGQGTRKEEPAEDLVSFVLLEKMCHMTQALPPLRCHEEKTFVERPQLRLDVRSAVMDLVYWKDIALSASVLTGLTVSLLCLTQFSVISVLSYAALILLCGSFTIRVYTALLHGLKRGDGANPFQKYLDMEPLLPAQQVEAVAARLVVLFFSALSTLRALFLVEDTKDSLKFLVLLYLLTYVGAVLNGLTLLLLGVIGLFTFPVMYKHNQVLVDRYVSVVSSRVSAFRAKFRAQLKKQGSKKD